MTNSLEMDLQLPTLALASHHADFGRSQVLQVAAVEAVL